MNKETIAFVSMVVLFAIGGLMQYSLLCGAGLVVYGLHGALEKVYNTDSEKRIEGVSAAVLGLLFIATGVVIIIHSYLYGMNYMWHR